MKTMRWWASAVCLGASCASGAFAATRYVAPPPNGSDANACTQAAPCATIQHAVDVAVNNDTVSVLPGTYVECVLITAKRITLVAAAFENSQNPADRALTTIDGTDLCDCSQGTCFPTVQIGTGCTIRGFTVKGGGDSGVIGIGGAVITRNIITGNSSENSPNQRGGGIQALTTLVYTDTLPLKIEYNDITNNRTFYWGGGIFLETRVDPSHRRPVSVKGNNIRNNSTAGTSTPTHNSGGAGVWIQVFSGATQSDVVVTQNVIEGNTAPTAVGTYGTVGGGIFVGSYAYTGGTDAVQVTSNQIRSNVSSQFGGGAALFTYTTTTGSSQLTLQGNIVEANTVIDASGISNDTFGGGIFAETVGDGHETILVDSNTVRNNVSATIAGGVAAWGFPSFTGIHNVNVQGNTITGNRADGGGGVDVFMTQTDKNKTCLGGTAPGTLCPLGTGCINGNLCTTPTGHGRVFVTDNDITSNRALGPLFGTGGGVEAFGETNRSNTQSTIDIVGNRIQLNTATATGGGAWLALAANGRPSSAPLQPAAHSVSTATFKNNLVTGNDAGAPTGQAPALGGGVVGTIDAEGDALVFLNVNFATIASNTDDAGVGGLEMETFSDFEDPLAQSGPNGEARFWVRNSILSGNAGVDLGGPEPGVDTGGSGNTTYVVDYNDILGDVDDWITFPSPDHNIGTDPLLDATFIPSPCSQTIDAADPAEDSSLEPPPNGGIANMGHTGNTAEAVVTLPDLNNDRFVDGVDILQIAISFASQFGEPRYIDTADVDRDGNIDGDDLSIVANDFGTGCP